MKFRGERGAVMLESTFCILLVIAVFMFLMSFGFFVYQKAMVGIVTNEVAEEVVQTYKLREVSDDSVITLKDITGIGKYRYLFFLSSFDSKSEAKAFSLTDARLAKTSFAKKEGTLHVDVQTIVDDIGRRHYAVTVKQKYSFMLGDLLNAIGQKGTQEIESTAYAESVDVLNYVNTVKTTKYGINKVKDNVQALRIIDKAISLLHSIFSI